MKLLSCRHLQAYNKKLIGNELQKLEYCSASTEMIQLKTEPQFEPIIPRPKGEFVERHLYQDNIILPIPYEAVHKAETDFKNQKGWFIRPKNISREDFNFYSAQLLFGNSQENSSKKLLSFQTKTVSQAFSAITDYLSRNEPGNTTVYVPNVGLDMHENLLQDFGLTTVPYRYYDKLNKTLDSKGLKEDIEKTLPNGSIVLFHLCAQNPTGLDLAEQDWFDVMQLCKRRNHTVILDCSNQGVASGQLDYDALVARVALQCDIKLICFQSMSYLFGFYGTDELCNLHILADNDNVEKIKQETKKHISSLGGLENIPNRMTIVANILKDAKLNEQWRSEVKRLTYLANSMRVQIIDHLLKTLKSQRDWSFLVQQKGLYCHFNFTELQIRRMRFTFLLFMTDSGRLSLIGVTKVAVPYIADALHELTRIREDDKAIYSRLTPQMLKFEQARLAEKREKEEQDLRKKEKEFLGDIQLETGEEDIQLGRKKNRE